MKSNALIIGLLVAILIVSTAGLVLEMIRPAREQRTVTATGVARMTVKPDIVHLELGAQTTAPSLQKAEQVNAIAMKQILAAVKAAGVKDSDIQTSSFYVTQSFDYTSVQPKPTGWQVTDTIMVTAKSELASVIIDAASGAGANVFNSITFDLSNEETLKAQLMQNAVANARAKAAGTLAGTSHTLGDLCSVSADTSGTSLLYPTEEGQGGSGGASSVSLGMNTLSVTVSVTFGLH